MLLSKLICDLEYKSIKNEADVEITGVCYDSRLLNGGELFVCVPGYETDGHNFVRDAVKRNAAAILSEKDVDADGIPVIIVEDTRAALASVSAAFYGYPARELRIIGVTGTNGKTTVTYMIKNLLEHCGYKVGLLGTVKNIIGDEVYASDMTTPEAPEIHRMLRKMADEKVNYAVMEVSSHALALKRVEGLQFRVGVITNLTSEHLDFHKTEEEYARAKALLFSQSEISVINGECRCKEIMKEAAKGKIVTYSTVNEEADVCAYNPLSNVNGVSFNVKNLNEDYRISLPIPGEFNIENALASAAVGFALEIPSGFIRLSFKRIRPVPGRLEKVETGKGFDVFIDYAHTPDGLEKVINSINKFKERRIITVFGCGGDRDKSKRAVMGKIATELSDFTVVTSDNPRSENPEMIIKEILEGCAGENFVAITDRREAIKYALSIAGERDIVLIAGKGHENYQITETGKTEFDEKKMIGELL